MPILDDFEPFESPKLLIESARKRIDNFETIASDFIKQCSYTIFKKIDPQTGENIAKIRLILDCLETLAQSSAERSQTCDTLSTKHFATAVPLWG